MNLFLLSERVYPGTSPGEHRTGIAATFEEARASFERAWRTLAAKPDQG
ncbi:hypothetical protein [Bradyrhizobium sp. sGM-13]|nr:hypothetical protein [Bradyrhizobium sp. sGM-13]